MILGAHHRYLFILLLGDLNLVSILSALEGSCMQVILTGAVQFI
jgi:hypothetical protein